MIGEALDFRDESEALASLLEDRDEQVFEQKTLFKEWRINDIIAHLHVWNAAARITLQSKEAFQEFIADAMRGLANRKRHLELQRAWIDEHEGGQSGKGLFETWRAQARALSEQYARADPETRVAWAGPEMSARAAIIARQMETWAHGQAIFDVLGCGREEKDRVRNICHLGVTTYSWTFRNRGEAPPLPKPHVKLTAPSGAIWEWNAPQMDHAVIGNAISFGQVVTQTRNVADTQLRTIGPHAERWMSFAQCFAGPPVDPPAKGARYKSLG